MTGRKAAMIFAVLAALTAAAMPEVPKASARALGATKGKSFSAGLVFIDGKFLPPPYTVERWGNGIRINGRFVTGPVIDWNEFLKTQSGVKVTKKTEEPAAVAPAPAPAPAPQATVSDDDDDSSLDDLFDDDPKPKKKAKKPEPRKSTFTVKKAPPKPKTTVSYALEGEFVMNDASKALVGRINAVRTEIDRMLRSGSFIFFGERYARISGDARTAKELIAKLPELLKGADSAASLMAAVRANGMYYITDMIGEELYRNRTDYRKLQEHRETMKKNAEWEQMMNGKLF